MALSLKSRTTIIQFILIIVIGAAISGTVGGVTSQINKWKNEEEVQAKMNDTLNASLTLMPRGSMVARVFVA
jgi:hypothetical protein